MLEKPVISPIRKYVSLSLLLLFQVHAQGPIIKTPTSSATINKVSYPWRKNITATIFWIGEKPSLKNPTPNNASSWDTKWQENYGGFDDPSPSGRATVGYRPAAFVPKLNPFYIALPYNDRLNHKHIKPEAPKVIPWFALSKVQGGKSCLKGQWVEIIYGNKRCFGQWEDCGPFNTTDWRYVFGGAQPSNKSNNNAGIDISPAIRDYFKMKSGAKVHWRFVLESEVPLGPWLKYGRFSSALNAKKLSKREKYINDMREASEAKARKREAALKEYLGN